MLHRRKRNLDAWAAGRLVNADDAEREVVELEGCADARLLMLCHPDGIHDGLIAAIGGRVRRAGFESRSFFNRQTSYRRVLAKRDAVNNATAEAAIAADDILADGHGGAHAFDSRKLFGVRDGHGERLRA